MPLIRKGKSQQRLTGKSGKTGINRGSRSHESRHSPSGWIYFILSQEQDAVKIGYAENVHSRLGMLQTGNPAKLHVFDCFRGSRHLEKMLHRKFARYRIKREWFRFHWRIQAFFEDVENLREAQVEGMVAAGHLKPLTTEHVILALQNVVLREKDILAIDIDAAPACSCDDDCTGACDDDSPPLPPVWGV